MLKGPVIGNSDSTAKIPDHCSMMSGHQLADPLPRGLSHTASKMTLASQSSPQGCLSVLMTWQLVSPRASDPTDQSRSGNVFYDLASHITHCHSAVWLSTQVSPYSLWQETIQGGKDPWGPSWRWLPL